MPIGVFDSGVGGLTVVAALREQLPDESILYLGDTARLPYGTKSKATVERYTRKNLEFLIGRGVKAVVVACNTASALALDTVDAEIPIWGVVEPGASQAARVSAGRIGVIATESTIRSGAYQRALHRHRSELEIINQPCPLFVPLVEEGWHDDPIATEVAKRYLEPLIDQKIDTLLLGCTHYPLLGPVLERIVGEDVRLVDSAYAVAKQVALELETIGMMTTTATPEHHFCVTDNSERFSRIASLVLGTPEVSLELVEV
jgi:glutamate racemase